MISSFAHGCVGVLMTLVVASKVWLQFPMLIHHPLRFVLPALITILKLESMTVSNKSS